MIYLQYFILKKYEISLNFGISDVVKYFLFV